MKSLSDILLRYIGREISVNVVGNDGVYIEGILREVGDGWILLDDEDSETIINTDKIIHIYVEEE